MAWIDISLLHTIYLCIDKVFESKMIAKNIIMSLHYLIKIYVSIPKYLAILSILSMVIFILAFSSFPM